MKLWFNSQSDISVLDATIAHIFQGTPRQDYIEKDFASGHKTQVRPTWKIRSDWYCDHRPQALYFPRNQPLVACDLHDNMLEPPQTHMNAHGLTCLCEATSNVDITTVFDFLCRQLGWRNSATAIEYKCREWHKARRRCNYDRFLQWTMRTDRLYELLHYFNEVPSNLTDVEALSYRTKEDVDKIKDGKKTVGINRLVREWRPTVIRWPTTLEMLLALRYSCAS